MDKLIELKKEQNAYVNQMGGYINVKEGDEYYNNLNREQIAALKEEYKSVFLGKINFCGNERLEVLENKKSVYEEYTGQTVFNFGCEFCVPSKDNELETLILEWNKKYRVEIINRIYDRIEVLRGICFIWK